MDTKDLRHRLGLTQEEMARVCNVSISTIRAWDQGLREPRGAALRLLQSLARDAPRRNDAQVREDEEDATDARAEERFLKRRGRGYRQSLAEFLHECERLR